VDEVGKGGMSEIHVQQLRLVEKPKCWVREEGKGHGQLKKKREEFVLVVMMGGGRCLGGARYTPAQVLITKT